MSQRSQTYWCHACHNSVELLVGRGELTCPLCHSEFLERRGTEFLVRGIDNMVNRVNQVRGNRAAIHSLERMNDAMVQFGLALSENHPQNFGPPPASTSAIEAMATITVSEEQRGGECPVCKDEFAQGTEVREMPCKHLYHGECLLTWLNQHNTCPVCRYELPTDDPDYEAAKVRGGATGDAGGAARTSIPVPVINSNHVEINPFPYHHHGGDEVGWPNWGPIDPLADSFNYARVAMLLGARNYNNNNNNNSTSGRARRISNNDNNDANTSSGRGGLLFVGNVDNNDNDDNNGNNASGRVGRRSRRNTQFVNNNDNNNNNVNASSGRGRRSGSNTSFVDNNDINNTASGRVRRSGSNTLFVNNNDDNNSNANTSSGRGRRSGSNNLLFNNNNDNNNLLTGVNNSSSGAYLRGTYGGRSSRNRNNMAFIDNNMIIDLLGEPGVNNNSGGGALGQGTYGGRGGESSILVGPGGSSEQDNMMNNINLASGGRTRSRSSMSRGRIPIPLDPQVEEPSRNNTSGSYIDTIMGSPSSAGMNVFPGEEERYFHVEWNNIRPLVNQALRRTRHRASDERQGGRNTRRRLNEDVNPDVDTDGYRGPGRHD